MSKNFGFLGTGSQPTIKLGPYPGKSTCLVFEYHLQEDLRLREEFHSICKELVRWVTYHRQWSDSPLYKDMCDAHFFVQSGPSDTFLMLEFWTWDMNAINNFVILLRGRFVFNQPKEMQ